MEKTFDPILGLDTSRKPVRLLVTFANEKRPGTVIPTEAHDFARLEDFREYWDEKWKETWSLKSARVAVPTTNADPLGILDWLQQTGQPLERYEWLCYRSHLPNDFTLSDIGISQNYQRCYVLATYACHRMQAAAVVTELWASLLDLTSQLEEARHVAHRLAAAIRAPEVPMGIPF